VRARLLLAGCLILVAALPGVALAQDTPAQMQSAPAGLTVDSDGAVYVTDYTSDRVLKFGADGSVVQQWGSSGSGSGQFDAPFGISVDERGAIYVVDQLNNRIQKFGPDGSAQTAWGKAGAGKGELRTPFAVAASSGRVYVADFGNDRVQVFSPDGSLLGSFGSRGSGDGQLLRPAGVAVGSDGSVYVADHFNDRVQKFSPDGHFQATLGTLVTPTPAGTPSPSATPAAVASLPDGQLRRPEGLAVDRDGNLWVADYGRDRVVKLSTADGHLMAALGGFSGPKSVAVDPASGRVLVADTGNARIQRFSPDGTLDTQWSLPALGAAQNP
jgi:tripartite motif-containing protein 71